MNRVVIGFLAVLVIIIILVYGARRLPKFNIRQYLPKTTASPAAELLPAATPASSSAGDIIPRQSPATVLPNSGILPATGL